MTWYQSLWSFLIWYLKKDRIWLFCHRTLYSVFWFLLFSRWFLFFLIMMHWLFKIPTIRMSRQSIYDWIPIPQNLSKTAAHLHVVQYLNVKSKINHSYATVIHYKMITRFHYGKFPHNCGTASAGELSGLYKTCFLRCAGILHKMESSKTEKLSKLLYNHASN